jgi:uncharacterized spore protein YtfJ
MCALNLWANKRSSREENMTTITELIEDMAATLADTANSDVVVGQAVELGSAKIIPLSKVSLAFGGAGGEGDQAFGHCRGKTEKSSHGCGKGTGSGAGGGARVRPVGVIIFTDEGVKVERIPDKSGPLDKIFEKIPELIDMAHKHGKGC